VCRENGVSDSTYYCSITKYGGMEASHIRMLKVLDEENRRLIQMYANLSLELEAFKLLLQKSPLAS